MDKDVPIDVQYNPEVVESILVDLRKELDSKSAQIQRDVDFMSLSLQQAFNLEMIKIPTRVKQMSLARFRAEFGESLEAVTRNNTTDTAMSGLKASVGAHNSASIPRASDKVLGTPASSHHRHTKVRIPREGERIVSANGSPLGEFSTAVKAPKENNSIIPQTPGAIVLDSGAVVDLETVDKLDAETKGEALLKVQVMMDNMNAMMAKLAKK
jgi:hypothetical protein